MKVFEVETDANLRRIPGPRQPLSRRLMWGALTLVAALAMLYVLLPWLIPKRWLADRVAAEIARLMNRGARIDRLDIGWASGVVIHGLTIDERPGFGEGPFVRVRRVQTEFSPLATLMGKPITRLNLNEPEVWIVILTENGVQRLNIADLGAEGTQSAPSGDWSAVRAAIHIVEENADLPSPTVASLGGGRARRNEVSVRLGSLACRLDAKTGLVSWDIRGQMPVDEASGAANIRPGAAEAIRTEGRLTVPKLKKGVDLSGGGRISWHRLDLTSLPVHLIPGGSIRRVSGWSAGTLEVRVHEDLRIDWRFESQLSDVAIHRHGTDQPTALSACGMSTHGRWNPTIDELMLDEVDAHLPGLRLQGAKVGDKPPIRIALRSDRRIDVNMMCESNNLEQLRQSVPELDRLLGRRTQTRGACRFEFDWARTTSRDRLRFAFDAENALVTHPDIIRAPTGTLSAATFDVTVDRQGDRLDLHNAQVRFGPFTVRGHMRVPWRVLVEPTRPVEQGADLLDVLAEAWPELQGEVLVTARPADRLTEYLPFLAEPLRDVRLSGPMDLVFGLDAGRVEAKTSMLRCDVAVPEAGSFAIAETFEKPAGQALSASAQLVLCHDSAATIRQLGLDVRCGGSRVWLDPNLSKARLTVERGSGNTVSATSAGGEEAVDRSTTVFANGFSASRSSGGGGTTTSTSEQEGPFVIHGHLAASLRIERIEGLLALMPSLSRRLEGQKIAGDCTVRIESNLDGVSLGRQMRPETWRVHADVEASRLGIDLPDRLSKPAGDEASISLDYLYDSLLTTLPHRHDLSFRMNGLSGRGSLAWGGGHEQGQIELDVTDMERALRHVPSLASSSAEYRLKGGVSMTIRSQRDPQRHVLSVLADAGNLGLYLPGADPLEKPVGVPCRLAATVESRPERDPSLPHEIAVREVVATVASCRFRAADGRIVTQPGTHEKLTGDYIARNPRWWLTASPFKEVALSTVGTIVIDSTLRSLSPAVDRLAAKYDLIGVAEAAIRLGVDQRGVRLVGRIDADRINLNASPHVVKAPGTRLGVAFDVTTRDQSAREGSTTGFVVRECNVEAWDMRFGGSGDFWLEHDPEGGGSRLGGLTAAATYDVPQLAHLQKLAPSLIAESLAGGVKGTISLATTGGQFRLGPSTLIARGVETTLADSKIELDGEMGVSSDRIDCEELRVRVGDNRLKVAAHIDDVGRSPKGSVFLIADELDIDRLREFLDRMQPGESSSRPSDHERIIKAQPIFEFLKRCDLTGRAHIGEARLTGEKTRKLFTVRQLISDFKVAAGRVSVPFTCTMNGGVVDGEFSLAANERNPYFDLKYKAVKVGAEDNVKAMVLYDFPGLHATGPTTLIDSTHQRFFNEPGVLNYPQGEGEWIIEGGAYVGRAAPLWLTRIFPGLNTARYEFTRMHDWFKKHVDGMIDHHMIYQGAYNIYMKGHSLPDGRSYYEVGIDLLAGYDSKYWSETGQGRVALFTVDARVENGVEVQKDIAFVPLHRVIYDVFLRSNVVTAAYYTIKKQMTKQE